jgi:hypothetical protein
MPSIGPGRDRGKERSRSSGTSGSARCGAPRPRRGRPRGARRTFARDSLRRSARRPSKRTMRPRGRARTWPSGRSWRTFECPVHQRSLLRLHEERAVSAPGDISQAGDRPGSPYRTRSRPVTWLPLPLRVRDARGAMYPDPAEFMRRTRWPCRGPPTGARIGGKEADLPQDDEAVSRPPASTRLRRADRRHQMSPTAVAPTTAPPSDSAA